MRSFNDGSILFGNCIVFGKASLVPISILCNACLSSFS